MPQHRIKTYLSIPLALTLFLAAGQVYADDGQPSPAPTEPVPAASPTLAEPIAEQPSSDSVAPAEEVALAPAPSSEPVAEVTPEVSGPVEDQSLPNSDGQPSNSPEPEVAVAAPVAQTAPVSVPAAQPAPTASTPAAAAPASTPAPVATAVPDKFSQLPSSGVYRFTERTGVKSEAKISSRDLDFYYPGESVRYDRKLIADGHNWLSYQNYRGGRSFVAISPVAPPAVAASVSVPVAQPSAPVSQPAPTTSTPAAAVPASTPAPVAAAVPDKFAQLPSSGVYRFTERTGVKSEAKLSSRDLDFYHPGESVRYDRKLTSDGHNWLSYQNYRGGRSFVAISPVATPAVAAPVSVPMAQPSATIAQPAPTASTPAAATPARTPASVAAAVPDKFSQLPSSGVYRFTERTGVKSEAKISSRDLDFYHPGESVRYDRKLTSDGHNWLSYLNYAGGRSFVAISPIATPVASAASVSVPMAQPSAPVVQPAPTMSTPAAAVPVSVSAPASVATAVPDKFAQLPSSGVYRFTERTGVKSEAKISSRDLDFYYPGESVRYDRKLTADGHNWLSYQNYRGGRSFVAISPVAPPAVAAPVSVSAVQPSAPVSQPAPTASTPAAAAPASTPAPVAVTVPDKFSQLPSSGVYRFTERTGVKSEAKISSRDLDFYHPGESVRYDRKLTADGHNWLGYQNYRGGRSFVAISPVATPAVAAPVSVPASQPSAPVAQPAPTASTPAAAAPVSTPAPVAVTVPDKFAQLPSSGVYRFTERTGVKSEAKLSSRDLDFYHPGESVRYDRKLTSDGHNWLSYLNYAGGRSFVAISPALPQAQSTPVSQPIADGAQAPAVERTDAADKQVVRVANKAFTVLGQHQPSTSILSTIASAIKQVEAQGYDLGFKLTDVASQKGIAYQADKRFYSASTIKAPYVVALTANRPETIWNQASTIKAVAQQSSNDGYAYLRETYGSQPINNWADQSGVSRDQVRARYPYLTADELHSLWETNYTYFNHDPKGRQVGQWFENPNLSPIKTTLGKSYKTQSKAGWIGGWGYHAANDAGIVYTPKGNYVLSVMSNADGKLSLLNPVVRALNDLYRNI